MKRKQHQSGQEADPGRRAGRCLVKTGTIAAADVSETSNSCVLLSSPAVRKSTRGSAKTEKEHGGRESLPPASLDSSSSLDKGPSAAGGQPEIQRAEVDTDVTSSVLPPESDGPDEQTVEVGEEEEKEGWNQADVKGSGGEIRPGTCFGASQFPLKNADFLYFYRMFLLLTFFFFSFLSCS